MCCPLHPEGNKSADFWWITGIDMPLGLGHCCGTSGGGPVKGSSLRADPDSGGTIGTEKPRDSGNCPGPAQGEHEPSLARSSLAPAGRRRLGLSDERAPTAPLLAAPGKERSRADSKCDTRNDPIGTHRRGMRAPAPRPAHGTSGEEQQHA